MTKTKKIISVSMVFLVLATLTMAIVSCQKSEQDSNISHYTCPMHPQIKMDDPGSCPICGMDLVAVEKEKKMSDEKPKEATISHYTCPMHPQIKMDDEGSCPICGMDLVPVHQEHEADHSAHDQKDKGLKINPLHVQNIGVKTDKIAIHSLSRSILAYGKVAHDTKLWVAQSEYIEALNLGDKSLIESSELKLKFLGLSPEWIAMIKKERKSDLGLHLPTKNESGYFEAFIHQGDVNIVQLGQSVEVIDDKGRVIQTGIVYAIGTIVDPSTRLVRVLVKSEKGTDFKSNTFVQFIIRIPIGEKLSIPSSAILFNGTHNMVYLVNSAGRYVARRVVLGEEGGDYFEVKEGLKEGDVVVTNGHFLIDSETKIKMGGESSGHNH